MDCSQLGFSVHGISQARILEWVAISFSRVSSWPGDWIHVSYIGRSILHHWATREALRNQIQDQTEFEFSAHWEWSGPNPQIRLKPFIWTVESRTWRKKKGRIGEVEKRKGRRRGKEVNKASYFLPHQSTLHQETRDKSISCGCWVWSIGGLAGPQEWSGC